MSESHGTSLRLKRREDLAKVAAYVKQQVREKSIEQVGEDLSGDNDFVGFRINEDKNTIIWHDYGHHGEHLDFNPIADSVIKEFPDVEMERQGWWGQEVWNYIIVDGEWQQYTLWKFVAYAKGKGEEVLMEYKEITDGLSDEEKQGERDRICKELAEQHSEKLPGVEIAVYCYDYFDLTCHTNEFYRAKDGCTSHEYVDGGLERLMYGDIDEMEDCIECVGQVLLYPMECAAEIIKRARKDEDWFPRYATEMMLYGDTARYFSQIEPSDKDWLMNLAEEHTDIGAIYCLLFGLNNKFRYWNETFVDEDTHEEVTLLRYVSVNGSTFEKQEGEEEHLVQIIINEPYHYSNEEIMKVYRAAPNNIELLQVCIDKGDKDATRQMYEKFYYGDEEHGIFINKKRAKEYYDLAGDVPFKGEWDPTDDDCEDDPTTYEYTLTGDAATLDGIETLIRDLCQKFGTPDNELGLFVPQRQLMKVLVGSDAGYYQGNVLSMERNASDCLIITTEANHGAPLFYALRQCFGNLNVEMKEAE
jgi:hypothetical protein